MAFPNFSGTMRNIPVAVLGAIFSGANFQVFGDAVHALTCGMSVGGLIKHGNLKHQGVTLERLNVVGLNRIMKARMKIAPESSSRRQG